MAWNRRSNVPEIWRGTVGGPLGSFREINRLQRRIDQMFEDFMNTAVPGITSGGFYPMPASMNFPEFFEMGTTQGFLPPCDIEETDHQYLVNFDLPGMRKEDLKIEIKDNQLTVSGERHIVHGIPEEEGRGKVTPPGLVTRERYHGTFLRSFTLPQDVDPNKVDAIYENGVLQIVVPKVAVRPGKQITVKEGRVIGQQPARKPGKPGEAA